MITLTTLKMIKEDAKQIRKLGFSIKESVVMARNDLIEIIAEEKQVERDNDDWENQLDQMGYDC